jgi:hypothetical protein
MGPIPSMPFAVIYSGDQPGSAAVIYSGDQPGSAASFAVIPPLVWPGSKDFRGGGDVAGCSFTVFNSDISDPGLFCTPEAVRRHV